MSQFIKKIKNKKRGKFFLFFLWQIKFFIIYYFEYLYDHKYIQS